MGLKEKRKGERGERLLRDKLREFGFDEVKRGSVFQGTSDLVGLSGIHPEVKFVEKLNIRKALKQATEEAEKREDGIPTVFSKTSREPWIVTMYLDDWIKLYEEWETHNG